MNVTVGAWRVIGSSEPAPAQQPYVQVIGEAAFGVKFEVMEKDSNGHIKENPIVSAAKYVLENTAKGAPCAGCVNTLVVVV